MANFKVVVSDPKAARAYQIDVQDANANGFLGKAIGDEVSGSLVGLDGYTITVTGGSDVSGFVMKADLPGSRRQKVMTASGVGYVPKTNGQRRRKFMRGREIATDIVQINAKITGYGEKSVEELLGLTGSDEAEE